MKSAVRPPWHHPGDLRQCSSNPAIRSLAGPSSQLLQRADHARHPLQRASGRSAEGRIEIVELTETDDEVLVRLPVRPLEGDQDCQGNPPTPFRIELDDPLGDREVVDAWVVPPRIVRPG
jgi:hypothetical protein